MKNIVFQHRSSHLLCRIDARIKLLVALALLLMVVSSNGALFPLLTAAITLGLCLSLQVPVRLLLIRFAEPLFIAAVVLLLKSFGAGETPLWHSRLPFLEITLYQEGLLEGLSLASRIIGGVAVVAAVGFATTFTELLAALSWLRIPREITEVALFAWRYLFVLADDAQVIHSAQKNRLGYVGIQRSFRSFGTLAGALVLKAFDASQAMTTSMIQRGYDGTLPLLHHTPLRMSELVSAVLAVTLMGVFWAL
jgi:cobalt/nickel transport system permease protein